MNAPTQFPLAALAAALALALASIAPALAAGEKPAKPAAAHQAASQRTFATPEEAARAFADAVKAGDAKAVVEIAGSESRAWIFSGDKVADAEDWKRFAANYAEKNAIAREGDAKAILLIGKDGLPFAAPIVKRGERWAFDAKAGREEITNRRVGRNELDTIQTLLAIVDAQREYAAGDPDRNGFHDYAPRFRASEGRRDGLYWPASAGEPGSPLGPLMAVAAREGYDKRPASGAPQPYHGYHYRMLTGQGKEAAGGAYGYLVNGKLLGGFAVVAYPAKHGVSGVMTFVVNHEGVVYEKNLGAATPTVAGSMKLFNPDKTWKKSQ